MVQMLFLLYVIQQKKSKPSILPLQDFEPLIESNLQPNIIFCPSLFCYFI